LLTRIRDDVTTGRVFKLQTVPAAAGPILSEGKRDRTALRLCIAPVRTLGEDVKDGLAAGLADEISAGLSRFRWISCVPATLWQGTPDGNPADATWAGLEGDIVLDGTLQRSGGRVRVNARLIDMRSAGQIVWAGRFDRELTDPLALQDDVAAAIVAQVDPELMKHEGRRSASLQASELSAQDLLLQALPALYRMERSAFLEARRILESSLQADPGNSVVHGWLAYWNLLFVGQGWSTNPAASTAEAVALAERAVMLDPSDARALTLAGHVRGFLGKHPEEATALHERALTLNPNLAIAWCFSGLSHSYMGRHDEGLRRINQACRLSPSDPHIFFFDMALIMPHLMRGDYASAIDVGRRAIELNPWFSSAYKGYLAALGHMGRTRESDEVLDRLLTLEPGFSVQQAMLRSPLSQPEDIERYAEGLRLAGLPEGTSDGLPVSVLVMNTPMADGSVPLRDPTLVLDQGPIDLVPLSQHSHSVMRDDPPANGRVWNEATW
jgi:TolB-like protein/Flp pilus assembly protein TadD